MSVKFNTVANKFIFSCSEPHQHTSLPEKAGKVNVRCLEMWIYHMNLVANNIPQIRIYQLEMQDQEEVIF